MTQDETLLDLARTALRDAARAVLQRAAERGLAIGDIGGIADCAAEFVLKRAKSDLLAQLGVTSDQFVELAMIEVARLMN